MCKVTGSAGGYPAFGLADISIEKREKPAPCKLHVKGYLAFVTFTDSTFHLFIGMLFWVVLTRRADIIAIRKLLMGCIVFIFKNGHRQ